MCLSLLGTWEGAQGEQWNETSTVLQVSMNIVWYGNLDLKRQVNFIVLNQNENFICLNNFLQQN